jgi:hypothetical protein
MFEQTFKNIDDILYKDAGVGSELEPSAQMKPSLACLTSNKSL